jgi:uncharacterized membrane protein YhaH (DUF805 family)/gas vesicle protein
MSKVIEKPQLSFTEALHEARGKLLQFNGRSRRSEFWWCALALLIANFILNLIPFIGGLVALVLSLLMIPLAFRRLHDSGHSGWWLGASMIIGCFYMCLLGSAIFSVVTGDASDTTELLQSVISSFGNPLVLITGFVNFILGIIILVFLLQDSKFGSNKYGESPKYVTVDDQAAGAKAEQSDFDKGIEKVGDTIDNIAEAAQDKAEDLAGKAKEGASDLVDKAKDVAEKAKDSAGDFVDKAKDSAENLVDKAKDAAENVADKAKDLTEKAKDAID